MSHARTAVFTLIAGCIASFLLSSCGGYTAPSMNSSMNTMAGGPMIAQLVPNSATAGSGGFTLTVNGSGFGTDAVVFWNGSMRGATYVTGNQLTVGISAADIANKGTIPVYVSTGGRNSNTVNFTVN